MSQFHKPEDEKRSVVIVDAPLSWLNQDLDGRMQLLHPPKCCLSHGALILA